VAVVVVTLACDHRHTGKLVKFSPGSSPADRLREARFSSKTTSLIAAAVFKAAASNCSRRAGLEKDRVRRHPGVLQYLIARELRCLVTLREKVRAAAKSHIRTNKVTLVSKGTTCEMRVVSNFRGWEHNDKGEFRKRVDESLAKRENRHG
jgi:hypothetical protein